MYCQVGVDDEHQKYQKILWKHSTKEPAGVCQIARMAFGQPAAPFSPIRSMRQCADDYDKYYPLGATAVKTSFYVNDLLTGADSAGRGIKLPDEISRTLDAG